MIPLYIMEEHNEAFMIWQRATEAGYLPPFGSALLHVDHHPDFEAGIYWGGMDSLFGDLDDMGRFAECLGIADFICPAIYQGAFNDVTFLRDFMSYMSKPASKAMRIDTSGALVTEDMTPLSRSAMLKLDADHRLFTYRSGGLRGPCGGLEPPRAVALDIDLDYFCWDDSRSGMADKRIEITEDAYRAVTENPYHSFRTLPKIIVRAVAEDGRYYLAYCGLPKPDPVATDERIEHRVGIFTDWLAGNEVRPRIISVCRSRYSGYTPASVWSFIERTLLARLKELYEYDSAG